MEIRMVKEFLVMYLKSGAHFIMTTLTQTLTITDPHDAQLHYNWGGKFPWEIVQGKSRGQGYVREHVRGSVRRRNVRTPSRNGIGETWSRYTPVVQQHC